MASRSSGVAVCNGAGTPTSSSEAAQLQTCDAPTFFRLRLATHLSLQAITAYFRQQLNPE